MRVIKVSDAHPLDKDSLDIEEVKIYSARSDRSPKSWSIYAECVQSASEFMFDLTVDKRILADFSKSNPQTSFGLSFRAFEEILADPLEAVAYMTRALYRHECEFYEKESMPVQALDFRGIQPNFRVGWGVGLLGTSVSLLLPPKIRQDIRNTLCIDRGDTPAPKSRKVVVTTANGHASLGWCFVHQEK